MKDNFNFAIRFGNWANKHCVGCNMYPAQCEGLSFYKILDKTEKEFGFDYSDNSFPSKCTIKLEHKEQPAKQIKPNKPIINKFTTYKQETLF